MKTHLIVIGTDGPLVPIEVTFPYPKQCVLVYDGPGRRAVLGY